MRNWGARLRTDLALCGYAAVTLENPALRVTVLPGRGGDVVEFLHKPTDTDFCTFLARGLLPAAQARGRGFMETYYGGWQEVFPNGGPPSEYGGARFDQHGEVALRPWECRVTADDEREVAVELEVRCLQTPFRLRRELRLRAGEPALRVRCTATNEGLVPHPAVWGLHLAFGPPFGRPGCRIVLPDGARTEEDAGDHACGAQLATLAAAPVEGEPTSVTYLTGFRAGRYRVLAPGGVSGIEVEWDAALLPYLWCWREAGASVGFPWHGGAYIFGLEPFSSQPNAGLAAAVGNGSALGFLPGQSHTLQWSARVLAAGESVADLDGPSPGEPAPTSAV